jgi:small GTP-binding protein
MTELSGYVLQKKVCLLGPHAVGKTSLVRRFVESIFEDRYLATVGVKIDRKRVNVRGRDLNLVLWDLEGNDDLRQSKRSHVRGASGYIVVADGCRRSTVDKAIAIQQRAESRSGPVPVVVALNKADLKADWEIGGADVKQLSQKGWTCLHTSARSGDGVDALFITLAERILVELNEHDAK